MEELQWLWCKSVVVLFVFLSSLFLVERMFEAESKKIRREIVDTNPWQNLGGDNKTTVPESTILKSLPYSKAIHEAVSRVDPIWV